MLERDPAKPWASMLDTAPGSAADALDDLRDLARGIYPPLLADRGLSAPRSRRRRASRRSRSRCETDGVERYPQEVEAAVYFCCARGAEQRREVLGRVAAATVALAQTNGTLTFAVADDGVGFAVGERTSNGTGLQGMADRLDAIGGALEIRSAPGEGTTVLGRVPVG